MIETEHKLEDTWCFWYSPRGKKSTETSENYHKQIKPVGSDSFCEKILKTYKIKVNLTLLRVFSVSIVSSENHQIFQLITS
jgi:hypothetical protein